MREQPTWKDNALIDETNAQLSSHLVRGFRESVPRFSVFPPRLSSFFPPLLFPILSFFLLFFFYPFTHEIPLRAFREWSIAIKRNETARQRARESELKPDEGRVDGLGEETRGTKTVGERW